MNTEGEFTKGQEVWLKAIIVDKKEDFDWGIEFSRRSIGGRICGFTHPSEIRTTEQIVQEHGASAPQNTAETPHFTHETPHNAELTAQNAEPCDGDECWVRAKYIEKNNFGNLVELFDGLVNKHVHIQDSDLHFTKPQTHEIIFTETDRTRKFIKGDKVRVVERWGRPLQDQEDFEDWGFKLNEVYEVAEDEDCDNAVKLINGEHYWYFPFYTLDLVEPSPEPKYWLHESPKTYSIYYKGQFGRVITAMLMQKELYTIEEAQEQCDKLNQK